MEYMIYRLYSEKLDKYFIGQINILNDRIKRHDRGYEKFHQKVFPGKQHEKLINH